MSANTILSKVAPYATYNTSSRVEMAAFDKLPITLRRRLAAAPAVITAQSVARFAKFRGAKACAVEVDRICAEVNAEWRANPCEALRR